ncbi:MAG: phosphoribosylanthranilate isomerase [Arenimonas sp.]
MRTRIKFCGLTRPGDVRLAVELGVDAIGFIFAKQSKRKLDEGQIEGLRQACSPLVSVIALFMDNTGVEVSAAIRGLSPNLLQFHGNENDTFCRSFGLPFIKSLPMGEGAPDPIQAIKRYPSASAFLLDGHRDGEAGGRGEKFDWTIIPTLNKPFFLAGGLTPENVAQAIKISHPYAVDVSSGIESAPGVKDGEKMAKFVEEVRNADRDAVSRDKQ